MQDFVDGSVLDDLRRQVAARFAGAPDGGPVALADRLLEALERRRGAAAQDPFSNPALLLALDLSRQIAAGELTDSELDGLVQYLAADGFVERSARLGRYLGETDPAANEARLEALFERLAVPPGAAAPIPFERFRARCEQELFGVVITAHPTFILSGELLTALAALATGRNGEDDAPLTAERRDALLDLIATARHGPDDDLSLAREHALSLLALGHIQRALRRAMRVLLSVARRHYPERWAELTPRLLTVASWVGYDLDGRSDIRWPDIIQKRLIVQAGQLAHYLDEVRRLRGVSQDDARELGDLFELMESRLALACSQIEDEARAFGAAGRDTAEGRAAIEATARRMFEGMSLRLTDAGGLVAMIDRALARAGDDELRLRLVLLRAELANFGLGMAHTHVRINATQVHNAIRKAVGLTSHPNDPRFRQSYLDRLGALHDSVQPQRINFGSVLAERTTVRQLFMVVAQLLKYSDRTAPIRFLIAECDSAFTVLAALYFARLYGCERWVDISPLFETERALEAGSRVVDQLLADRHYRAYVEQRGRLCIQTGFSDAGRFIGQTPAAASIERLRQRLIRVLAARDLRHVQLVIFDTHGESIGRGAHPASFAERLRYVDTPATRRQMAELGIDVKQEVSFQGGDGLVYFVNGAAAFAAVTRMLEHALAPPPAAADADPFYQEAAYIREFFTTVKEFQVGLMNDPNYGVLLTAFGANLLYPAGSRAVRRQHEEPADIDVARPSQMRAIPHNAVLHQLQLPANSVGGVGAAIAQDPERFRALYARSPRLRQLMGIVEFGAALSDPTVMRAYIDLLDPQFWVIAAAATADRARAEDMLRLADVLEESTLTERQHRVSRKLQRDLAVLVEALRAVAGEAGSDLGPSPASRDRLALLQAVRLATMQELFLLAIRIPDFSGRHGATRKQLIGRLLHLDVPAVVELLEEIFPLREEPIDLAAFGEPADAVPDDTQNYQFENEQIFRPMLALYDRVRRISVAVTHRVGFFG